jgi:hypothetical protein
MEQCEWPFDGMNGIAMLLRAPKRDRLKIGDRLGVAFEPASVYWFDTTTGLRVRTPPLI